MLTDYSTARRRAILSASLDRVLAALASPASTHELTDLVEADLLAEFGSPQITGRTERAWLARHLLTLASVTPEARQSEFAFKRYGREMRAWVWSPRRSATPAAPAQSEPGTYTAADGRVLVISPAWNDARRAAEIAGFDLAPLREADYGDTGDRYAPDAGQEEW